MNVLSSKSIQAMLYMMDDGGCYLRLLEPITGLASWTEALTDEVNQRDSFQQVTQQKSQELMEALRVYQAGKSI